MVKQCKEVCTPVYIKTLSSKVYVENTITNRKYNINVRRLGYQLPKMKESSMNDSI